MTDIKNIYELLLQKINKKQIFENEPMSKHTTFKIGGNALLFVIAKSEYDIKHVLRISKEYNVPLYVLGNGSNILVKDTGFNGIILKIELCNIEYTEKENKVEITVGAGYKLGKLSRRIIKKRYSRF